MSDDITIHCSKIFEFVCYLHFKELFTSELFTYRSDSFIKHPRILIKSDVSYIFKNILVDTHDDY